MGQHRFCLGELGLTPHACAGVFAVPDVLSVAAAAMMFSCAHPIFPTALCIHAWNHVVCAVALRLTRVSMRGHCGVMRRVQAEHDGLDAPEARDCARPHLR